MATAPKRPMMNDRDLARIHFSPVCTYCEYWQAGDGTTCAAYPTRIPDAIWSGKSMHLTAYGGEKRDKAGQPIVFAPAAGVKRNPANAKLLDAYTAAHKE